VVGGEELIQRPTHPHVDAVAHGGDVAGGVARILLVLVRLRVVDVPVSSGYRKSSRWSA